MYGGYTVFFDCLFLSCTVYIESTGMAARFPYLRLEDLRLEEKYN